MASLPFPDTGTRLVILPSGRPAVNVTGHLYADSTLTGPAEIYLDVNGVKGALVSADSSGRVPITLNAHGEQPDYWGPAAGTDRLWIVVNGVASKVDADYNARLDGLGVRVAAFEAGGSSEAATAAALAAEASARSAADTAAIATAATDATSKVATEATNRASGDTAAVAAAAADATTKANAAQAAAISAAISAAATDATTKVATETTARTAADLLKVTKGDLFIDPRDAPYNADPTGVADATTAMIAAVAAANATVRTGLAASILHPGATLVLQGTFNLSTLAAPLEVRCNVVNHGAEFIVPASYAGVAVLVGHSGDGMILQAADISLPDIRKPTSTAIVAGSVGVRVQNLFNSRLNLARTLYFETGLHFTGWNNGTSYCRIFIGWMSYCKVSILMKPHLAGGYANQCTFVGGGIQQSPGYAGGSKVTGWRHLVMDGNNISNVTGNAFYDVSFEGDASEYVFEFRGAYDNTWDSCRHEQGVAAVACTVAGGASATITKVAHGLAVGDMMTFSCTVAPTGMYQIVPYYVVTTPTADTFTVSAQKGGTAVTFATTGTAVTYFRPQKILIDASTSQLVSHNTIRLPMTPLRALDVVQLGSNATNNGIQWTDRVTMDAFVDSDTPLYRARNRSGTTVSAPLWAAYTATVNPVEDPYNWTTALGARGLIFAASRAEIGRIFGSGGIIQYQRPTDSVSYELASCRRSPGLITSIVSLSVPANTTTTSTFTLTGASVSDHVLVTPVGGMLAGVILSHAYVSSADTVTITFGNLTAAPIVISPTLQAIAFRRFF